MHLYVYMCIRIKTHEFFPFDATVAVKGDGKLSESCYKKIGIESVASREGGRASISEYTRRYRHIGDMNE